MKKLTALLLAMAMVLSLAACNSNPGGGENSGPASDPNA